MNMKQFNKLAIYFLSSFCMFFALLGGAYAQTIDVYLDPAASSQNPGVEFTLSVYYGTTPEDKTLQAPGVDFFFDSTKLEFKGFENIFQKNLNAVEDVPQPDTTDADSDADTDSLVKLLWSDFGGAWPGEDAVFPLKLADLKFEVLSGTGSGETRVNVNTPFTPPGYSRNFTGATVTVVPLYTVTFEDWDGTVLKTEEVEHGSGATAPVDEPEREGYTFTGWAPAFDNVTGDLTVTAQYEVFKYTVTFEDWDGTVLKTQEVEYGESATAPADPVRAGHIFTGWAPAFDNVTANLTVIAQYTIIKYTVTFLDCDGELLTTEEVEYGSGATAPQVPDKEGFTFVGWDVSFDNVTDNLTVNAQCEIIKYTVTFEDWDGSVLKTEEVEHGSGATAPVDDPEREGHIFLGWEPSEFNNVTANLTVTAQYEVIKYTVTFKDYNGEVLDTQEVAYGESATAPDDPVREGFRFTGWDVGFDNITSNLDVIAQYTRVHTLTYLADVGGEISPADNAVQTVDHGDDGMPVVANAFEGYEFVQWDDGSTKNPRTDENVTEDITVTAQFIAYVATPGFDPDGGLFPGNSVDVTVTCATEGATIGYTTDGTEPIEEVSPTVDSGGVVSVPIPGPFGTQCILRAKAWKEGMNPSQVKTAIYEKGMPDGIGLYDQDSADFYISNALETGPAEENFRFGPRANNWIPIAGDWNGDGYDTVGLYDRAMGRFYLSYGLEGEAADKVYRFGPRANNWIPVAGDWNGDGLDSVGLYDPAGGKFYLVSSLEGAGSPADIEFRFGPRDSNWIPVAGDWDGNGLDEIGLYNQAAAKFYLVNNLEGEGSPADVEFRFGPRENNWLPVAGDWDRDGLDEIGLYDNELARFYLSYGLEGGIADEAFGIGPRHNDWIPTAGKWDLF